MLLKRIIRMGIVLLSLLVIYKIFFSSIYPIAQHVRIDVENIVNEHGAVYLPIDQIPLEFQTSVISTEDRRFYSHPGVDVKGVGRSLYINLQEGLIQGGSTITSS